MVWREARLPGSDVRLLSSVELGSLAMDATATPRGISLAVGELGARGRPINEQCTAVRISSTVNGDMCGTCLPSALIVCPCERRPQPTALVSPPSLPMCALSRLWGWSCNGVSCGAVVCCRASVAGGGRGTFPPFAINNALESMCGHDLEWSPSPRQAHDDRPSIPRQEGRRLS